VVATIGPGAACPLAVQAAIDATLAARPGFVCILPGWLLLSSPWAHAVTAIVMDRMVGSPKNTTVTAD
jgi:hypothetical protein